MQPGEAVGLLDVGTAFEREQAATGVAAAMTHMIGRCVEHAHAQASATAVDGATAGTGPTLTTAIATAVSASKRFSAWSRPNMASRPVIITVRSRVSEPWTTACSGDAPAFLSWRHSCT